MNHLVVDLIYKLYMGQLWSLYNMSHNAETYNNHLYATETNNNYNTYS